METRVLIVRLVCRFRVPSYYNPHFRYISPGDNRILRIQLFRKPLLIPVQALIVYAPSMDLFKSHDSGKSGESKHLSSSLSGDVV